MSQAVRLGGGGGSGNITSINTDATAAQTLTTGTSGTDFAIVDNGSGDHKFNIPTASASNRGLLSTSDWTTFNNKVGGSGTTDRLTRWASSSSLAASQWKEDSTNGYWQYKGSANGSVTSPLIEFDSTLHSGIYKDSSGDLYWADQGSNIFSTEPGNFYIYSGSNKHFAIKPYGLLGLINGQTGQQFAGLTVRASNNAVENQLRMETSGGVQMFAMYSLPDSNTTDPRLGTFYGSSADSRQDLSFSSTRSGGQAIASSRKANALTINQRADLSNVGGTTTANASTTLTMSGTGSMPWSNFGIGDRVSVSSASSTYAYISGLSATDITTLTALGNGTSQTVNRKQAMFRIANSSGDSKLFMNDEGRLVFNWDTGFLPPSTTDAFLFNFGTSSTDKFHFVQGSTTGTSSTDGVSFSFDSGSDWYFTHNETKDFYFKLGGTSRARVRGDNGRMTVGDTTETINFFLNDATKFQVGTEITTVATSIATIIQAAAGSIVEVNPSADTGSGIGASVYAAHGFNLKTFGTKTWSGLPFGTQTLYSFSAVGAFGQIVNNCPSGTQDSIVGVLLTSAHNGYGSTQTGSIIGGYFDANTSDEQGLGTPTGTVNEVIAGFFTAGGQGGVDIPKAISGRFVEPQSIGGFAYTSVITNQVAAWVDGTLAITRTESTTAANMSNLNCLSSFLKLTGSTAANLHGIHADVFEKQVTLYNGASQPVTIKNQSGTEGTAANRIITPFALDFVLCPNESAQLNYDASQSRWIVTGVNAQPISEYSAGNSSTAITINWNNGYEQTVTMTGNCTFTLSNPVLGKIYVLRLIQDGTGSRTYTWPASVKWPGGTAPTGSGANKVDMVYLYYDGTNYRGRYDLNY